MGEAERLRAGGAAAEAAGVEEVAEAMRRHVDRELARARIASAGRAAACDPAQIVPRLVAVLRRTRDGARVDWDLDARPGLLARIDPDDLTEALGALLENAARHAASRVRVATARAGASVTITVADDGPGIPAPELARLTSRGARLDLGGPGAGLGLAIATRDRRGGRRQPGARERRGRPGGGAPAAGGAAADLTDADVARQSGVSREPVGDAASRPAGRPT